MSGIDEVRPVEALWLLSHYEDEGFWSEEVALRATLIDLAVRGLIETDYNEETFQPTGKEPELPLRQYEEELIEAIDGIDSQREMVDAAYWFDFEAFFIEHGVLERVTIEKPVRVFGVSLFSRTETVVREGEEYEEVMEAIRSEKQRVAAAVEAEELAVHQMPFVYAFPASPFYNRLLERDVEGVIDTEAAANETVTSAEGTRYEHSAAVRSSSLTTAVAAAGAASGAAGGGGGGAA